MQVKSVEAMYYATMIHDTQALGALHNEARRCASSEVFGAI